MAARGCDITGCRNKHRARGLCATHYNQRLPGRHRRTITRCTVCRCRIQRPRRSDRRPTCSPECRAALQDGTYKPEIRWADEAMQRAREAGAYIVEVIYRIDVFERDGWRCHVCGGVTNRLVSIYDPSSPTVDHVAPLSCGGQHVMANVRCAHLRCNSLKPHRGSTPSVRHG